MSSCTEDTEEQDKLEKEQRFFDIYMAANYPDASPQPSGLYYVENKEGTGEMPTDSSWVLINHVAYTIPDDKVYDTYIVWPLITGWKILLPCTVPIKYKMVF